MAIFLWTLAFWFFAIPFVASMEAVTRNDFHLNWYAYVFPNVGFTIATIGIGEGLDRNGIKGVGTGMAAVLLFLIVIVFATSKLSSIARYAGLERMKILIE
jgi:tellurite resistance protein TehA-like permease